MQSALALLFLVLAAAFQKQNSVRCVMCVGFLGLGAALLPFMPNYVEVLELEQYYEGCGAKFDKFIRMTLNVVLGSGFSVVAGWMMFAYLFSLPISFVRGLWLLLLKPLPRVEEPQQAAEELTQAAKDRGLSEELLGILSIAMRYLACIIPLLTAFPLLLAFQVVEDRRSWWCLVGFWLLPQLWILKQKSSCENKGDRVAVTQTEP